MTIISRPRLYSSWYDASFPDDTVWDLPRQPNRSTPLLATIPETTVIHHPLHINNLPNRFVLRVDRMDSNDSTILWFDNWQLVVTDSGMMYGEHESHCLDTPIPNPLWIYGYHNQDDNLLELDCQQVGKLTTTDKQTISYPHNVTMMEHVPNPFVG